MSELNASTFWSRIEKSLGTTDLEDFVSKEIQPELNGIKSDTKSQDTTPWQVLVPMLLGFISFIILWNLLGRFTPDNAIGIAIDFITFPLTFFACIAASAFLFRNKIAEVFAKSGRIFIARSSVLKLIATRLGLEYAPLPGGPAANLKTFAKWKHCPDIVKDLVSLMETHTGFDQASETIRRSGLATSSAHVLGSQETKDKYYAQEADNVQLEDGFKGHRSGIDFTALEWTDTSNDSRVDHLFIILDISTALTGRVEFKNKPASWPANKSGTPMNDVKLISKTFSKLWNVRANDQMEGRLIFDPAVIERLTEFSKNAPIRGVAFENTLIIDIVGKNGFNIVDIITGYCDESTIRTTFEDFENLFKLVDAAGHIFSTQKARQANAI